MDSKKISEQFELLYKSKIERNIAPLEEERKKYLQLYKIIIWTILVEFLFSAIVFVKGVSNAFYVYIVFFLTGIFSVFFLSSKHDKYRKKVKNKLLMEIFSIFGQFYYCNNPVISLQEIKDYGLFSKASIKKDDDVIVGKYKDIEISITETKLYQTKASNTYRSIPDFSGLILKIKMNKNFEGHTVVTQKPMSYEQFLNNMKNFYTKNSELVPANVLSVIESPVVKFIFQGMQFADKQGISISADGGLNIHLLKNMSKKPRKLEEVKLEDAEFNNIFDIYSDNQVEARYLLTPSFMERLKMISMVMLVMDIHCVFKDGYITLFLGNPIMIDQTSDRGFFELEPGYKETLYNKEVYKRVFIELLTIFDFIQYFKLDQKIGL